MVLEDSFEVGAPIEEVWQVLSDPIALAECFPGVEVATRIDEVRTRARLRIKISYISATFDLEGEVFESKPPHVVRSRVQGKDGRLGCMVIGETALSLSRTSEGTETRVQYAGDLRITGYVASLGRPFIERKAKHELAEFVKNVQRRFRARESA